MPRSRRVWDWGDRIIARGAGCFLKRYTARREGPELVALIGPYAPEDRRGRQLFAIEMMLRTDFMQQRSLPKRAVALIVSRPRLGRTSTDHSRLPIAYRLPLIADKPEQGPSKKTKKCGGQNRSWLKPYVDEFATDRLPRALSMAMPSLCQASRFSDA